MIRDVNDLEVYKMSLELLGNLYRLLEKVPKSEYDVIKNCKRAAKSIPANLAEGWAKRSSQATFKNHLKIGIGSSDEVAAHLETISVITPWLKDKQDVLVEKYRYLSRRLNSLHKIWKSG